MKRRIASLAPTLSIVGSVAVVAILVLAAQRCGRGMDAPALGGTLAVTVIIVPNSTATPSLSSSTSPLSNPATSPLPAPAFTFMPAPPLTPTAETGTRPQDSPLPAATPDVREPMYTYRVIRSYPHDRGAFTQGLIAVNGLLVEGTGLNGRSSLRRVELESGKVLQSVPLESDYFGEGVTLLGNRIYQLTWKSQIGFVYDWPTLERVGEWRYEGEGWGLTHDGTHLIMSDGTSTLRFIDPETMQVVRRVEVISGFGPVSQINELEYVRGEIYANLWRTNHIARIDPESGAVRGWIDLNGLLTEEERAQGVDVLNGIAYDPDHDRLFVTGKLWPRLFEIELQLR